MIIKAGTVITLEEGEHSTKEYRCRPELTAWWDSDDKPADPLTVHVELPLGPDEDGGPAWEFTLGELVDDFISWIEMGEGGPIGSKDRHKAKAVRDGLRGLADRIDARLVADPEAHDR